MPYESLRRGRISLTGYYYLLTTTTADRQSLFQSLTAGRVVINALRSLDTAELTQTLACVVMPDHVHWLMRLGRSPLAEMMQRFKGRCARALSPFAGSPVWQKGFHDRAVRSDESLEAIARYVIENPVRAGLAKHIGDYPLWHSVWAFE